MRCLHSCWGAASRWAYRRLGDAAVWTFFSFVVGKPQRPLNEVPAPAEPDYEEDGAWCCLPGTQGTAASLYPADDDDAELSRRIQETGDAPADCFYVHATASVGGVDKYNESFWGTTSEAVEQSFLGFAAALNHCCNIYAPRYRHATFGSILCPFDRESSIAAADLAYGDVKRAFAAFLKRTSASGKAKPFFLFGHSQGAVHLSRLVQDVVDRDEDLCMRLVCVYAIGSGNAGLPADLKHLKRLHASRGPTDSPGALVSMNLRATDFDTDSDLIERMKARYEKMVCRWDLQTGWTKSVAHAQEFEPVLTVSPASWRPEPNGTVTHLKPGSTFSYRGLRWKNDRAPGLRSMLLGQPEGVECVAMDRIRSKSYLPSFVQRGQHVLLMPRLEDCGDPALRQLASEHSFVLDEGGYHILEPTLLHFLIRKNARVRLQSWMARESLRESR